MEYVIAGVCLLASALFSGLTIGLMGLDLTTLRHKAKQGDIDAMRVSVVRKDGMLLLTTLLLGNAAASSFFSIFMGATLSGVWAGIISTVFLFLVGEILPQAVVSRFALRFGGATAPFVRILMKLLYPVCGPIAWLLNKLLGQEAETSLTKHDLLTILEDEKTIAHADVDTDERRIMRGSLLYSHRTVADVLTPAPVVFSVQETDVLTQDFLLKLRDMGFSRIPVHTGDKNQYIGILYLKDLVGVVCPSTVEAQMDKTVHFVSPTDRLDGVLNEFILTKMHLFIVLDEFGAFEGVITVEDIVEEIIGQEIMDEDDDTPDMREHARRTRHQK